MLPLSLSCYRQTPMKYVSKIFVVIVDPRVGTSSVASKYEELECLYAAVGKVIYEGLTNYEKATSANPSQLFGEFPVCCTIMCRGCLVFFFVTKLS